MKSALFKAISLSFMIAVSCLEEEITSFRPDVTKLPHNSNLRQTTPKVEEEEIRQTSTVTPQELKVKQRFFGFDIHPHYDR